MPMYLYLFIVVAQDLVGVRGGVLLGWRPGSRCLTRVVRFCGRGVDALAGFLSVRHIKTRVQQTFFSSPTVDGRPAQPRRENFEDSASQKPVKS